MGGGPKRGGGNTGSGRAAGAAGGQPPGQSGAPGAGLPLRDGSLGGTWEARPRLTRGGDGQSVSSNSVFPGERGRPMR